MSKRSKVAILLLDQLIGHAERLREELGGGSGDEQVTTRRRRGKKATTLAGPNGDATDAAAPGEED